MKKNDIIESLNKHIKDNPNKKFYINCINEINGLEKSNEGIIKKIIMNKYVLEAIRITILYNINKYKIYLSNKEMNNCTNYLLDIKRNIKQKLVYQLACITKYNNILALENDQIVPEINFDNGFYVVISEIRMEGDELFELKNLYDIMGYIFGIEIFNILKYQQLDRIIGFIEKFIDGDMNGYNIMENYLSSIRKDDWRFRDNMVIIGNTIFNTLGLVTKKKIELLGILDWNSNDAASIAGEFDDNVDAIITTNNESLYQKNGKCTKYSYRWLVNVLPAFIGADNIHDMICDPTYTFNFMGIKFMSLDFIINKLLYELNSGTFLDLLMMEKICGYNIGKKLCIPNMIVKYGKVKIFNDNTIKDLHNKILEKAKNIYNIELTHKDIIDKIFKCSDDAFDIYKGVNVYDPDTAIIRKFNRNVKANIFFEYCKGKEYLLDIGVGQFADLQFYNKIGIINMVGIEPSQTSIENGYKRIEKYGTKTKVSIVNGIGNEPWKGNKKYDIVTANKYDVISFQFTIHYMIQDIDIVMNNIVGLCKSGTVVIITCMDGNLIFEEIKKKGFIEVRNDIEPLFGIYPLYDYKSGGVGIESDVMVYFKGSYGVVAGSKEKLVDINKLVDVFNGYGFGLVKHKNFIDYNF